MFNFGSIFEQAAELLHSSNVAELMAGEAPFDLQETMTQFGITPADLQARRRAVPGLMRVTAMPGPPLSGQLQQLWTIRGILSRW